MRPQWTVEKAFEAAGVSALLANLGASSDGTEESYEYGPAPSC